MSYDQDFPLASDGALKSSEIHDTLPYCSGVLHVRPKDLAIYYGKDGNARQLTLPRPSMSSLEHLVSMCEPASFGNENEDVYRKPGKLSYGSFRPMLDVNSIGVLKVICDRLLGGNMSTRAKLHNLNIYGPGEGSVFKAHDDVDTPRGRRCGEGMFGSLVIFYPTKYEGGILVLRKNNQEWRFDSSKMLADDQVGYLALYNDVDYEVLPVTSGYFISVTYDLYFEDSLNPPPSLPIPFASASTMNTFISTLEELLDDSSLLSRGGYLGFALEYAYLSHTRVSQIDLSKVKRCLKGVDADVMAACKGLGLATSL
ncbi:hypothetical protein JOM56_004842 [Amanita muscaria]